VQEAWQVSGIGVADLKENYRSWMYDSMYLFCRNDEITARIALRLWKPVFSFAALEERACEENEEGDDC